MLGIFERISVEKVFRDNFLRFFPSRKVKTMKKPTLSDIAKMKFSAAEEPKTL